MIESRPAGTAPATVLQGADLARLRHELPEAFDVSLITTAGNVTLRCEAVLRILPGRRIVARAVADGRTVLAKLFVGPRAPVERQWEERGHAAFLRAGVATPEIVGRGTIHGGGEALLFEFLENALPANEFDLPQTMPILARLHMHGVVQNDLHLNNLLRTDRGLFLVDGGGVSGMGTDKPLSQRASVRNLALFLAQFRIRAESTFVAAWHAYSVARGYKTIDADGAELLDAVHRARRSRERDYMRKVLRECSEFHAERHFDRHVVCDRSSLDSVAPLIDDIDAQFERGFLIKDGNTVTVARLYVDGEAFVIKRYNIKSWRHAIGRMWRPTRAQRAWQNAHRLRMLGIPTFRPVALVERRFGPLRRGAYLVMRDVGGVDLRERLSNKHIQSLVDLFGDLARAGLVHGDTKATNFVEVGGLIHLIDLDAMRAPRTKRGLHRGLARDLERFIANWTDSATIRAALTRAFAALTSNGAPHAR